MCGGCIYREKNIQRRNLHFMQKIKRTFKVELSNTIVHVMLDNILQSYAAFFFFFNISTLLPFYYY
jgi:hypothetical protein